ncbi:hypothetical protein [Ignicoccus hospitalis]|uniref:Uncharacterized protein n=1 Tax=Ignicoccus hospitalis (strain KIN4/I / DSM 18386 / JCM 14125) TaxID=453591 RepID=A8AC81_IGNH4|nr:hypothetical protein [Ignicoccus hospitalis]ABU82533.1 hypothetical protein Igni_1357 [Ignicoccus hospitalis KIN4/I]HIH90698.1 hypothetical protein [Desulfurococcaceae archaeon]
MRVNGRRLKSLKKLEALGLNVPLYAIVTRDGTERVKHFKKQCAVRFDYLECSLPRLPGEVIVVEGPPPLIAHSSPCVAPLLPELLKCNFTAHVTDVTIKDSVGAGVTLKTKDNKIIIEATTKGSVRDITRKGIFDVTANFVGNVLVAKGPVEGLLSYCMFESAKAARRLPPGALEWSCHKGRYGIKGDHVVFWEHIELRSSGQLHPNRYPRSED